MSQPSPGSYAPPADRWGPFKSFAPELPAACLAVVDKVVAHKHPRVLKALKAKRERTVLVMQSGEEAKSFAVLEQVLEAGAHLPRSATLICVGGGTLGDLATVAAHLFKRGIRLIQVPSTLLAAVDSSLGGKGAVDLHVGRRIIKNAAGVFHYASESWLCPELFETLPEQQLREGAVEAWKKAICLDATLFEALQRRPPSLQTLIREARRMKGEVCAQDPYERSGLRAVLNFGHTFGHVIESASRFRVSHGDSVGLGILCALDVGRAMGLTSEPLAESVEAALEKGPGLLGRGAMAQALRRIDSKGVAQLLAADKKSERLGEVKMVLLRAPGQTERVEIAPMLWKRLLKDWQAGRKPAVRYRTHR